jgi:hypothetical protein
VASPESAPAREYDIQGDLEEQITDHRLNPEGAHPKAMERDTAATASPKQTRNEQTGRDSEAKFQQHENQREPSPLSKLLQQCETAVSGVTRIPIRGRVSMEAERPVQQTCHTARSKNDVSQKSVRFQRPAQRPDIYPELRCFDKLTWEEEDHPKQPATTLHSNGEKFCLDLDLESLQAEECLSDMGEDEASSIHTEFLDLGAVDDICRQLPPGDARGLNASDDWYENFLGAHQVPADFWRPNKLY